MTTFETSWPNSGDVCIDLFKALERLAEMEFDELIEFQPFKLVVTEKGKPFVRNVCMAFDARLWENKPEAELFSQTI